MTDPAPLTFAELETRIGHTIKATTYHHDDHDDFDEIGGAPTPAAEIICQLVAIPTVIDPVWIVINHANKKREDYRFLTVDPTDICSCTGCVKRRTGRTPLTPTPTPET